MVDLDGARIGVPVNLAHVARIAHVTALPVQLGGGLRSIGAIEAAFAAGVSASCSAPPRSPMRRC